MTDQAQEAWADALADDIQTKYPGVRLQLGIDRGPHLALFWLLLPESERGRGLGTQIMKHLITAADAHDVPITLSPSNKFGGDLDRLHTFYQRLGFAPNTRRGELDAPQEIMVRTPRSSAPDSKQQTTAEDAVRTSHASAQLPGGGR
ncbi:GNAT family N-acetyltransferase [Streptomyces microflavus]|uniref:GNAT family N-acetyltransferase n=1 Tax=Streptomyces microflavus TaxID=1919 RepID=UPI0029ABB51C|nr:GNAT family N-acetyltransferase [Streptomyces microflavus]MDX2407356.1 GNAT family N-acetyltransferase [Streptomyces microflavus]